MNNPSTETSAKIAVNCVLCGQQVHIYKCKLKTFKYCSDECKHLSKKTQIPHNKIFEHQKHVYECFNPLCSNTFSVKSSEEKKIYCSLKCANQMKSLEHQEKIKELKEKETKDFKRKIWFI